MVAIHLEEALAHLAVARLPDALESLLDAWRSKPDSPLADLIDALSPKAEAAPQLTGLEKQALQSAWMALSAADQPASLPELLRTLLRGSVAEVTARLESLTVRKADPRMTDVLIRLVREVPFAASTSKGLWTWVFKLLSSTRDARAIPALQAVCAQPLPPAGPAMQEFFGKARPQALEQARNSVAREKERLESNELTLSLRLKQVIASIPDRPAARPADASPAGPPLYPGMPFTAAAPSGPPLYPGMPSAPSSAPAARGPAIPAPSPIIPSPAPAVPTPTPAVPSPSPAPAVPPPYHVIPTPAPSISAPPQAKSAPAVRAPASAPGSPRKGNVALQQVLMGHHSQANSAAVSMSGRLGALAAASVGVYVLESNTGKVLRCFFGESQALRFSLDDRWLATSRQEKRGGYTVDLLTLWDLASAKPVAAFDPVDCKEYTSIRAIAFHPRDRSLALGLKTRTVLWNPATGQTRLLETCERVLRNGVVSRPTGSGEPASLVRDSMAGAFALAFSPDSRLVATLTINLLEIWDFATGKRLTRHELAVPDLTAALVVQPERYTAVAFHPSGKSLVVAVFQAGRHTLRTLELPLGKPVDLASGAQEVEQMGFSPDGTILACRKGSSLTFLDAATGQPRGMPVDHGNPISDFCLASDGSLLSAGGLGGVARWSLATRQVTQRSHGFPRSVQSLIFSPDSARLVTGGGDGAAWIWDVKTGAVIQRHSFSQATVAALACAPDGRRLLIGHNNQVWYVDPAVKEPSALRGHRATVRAVAFTPDGTAAATASVDKTLRIWDLKTGASQKLDGHGEEVSAVVFAPSGQRFYSAGMDQSVIVWDFKGKQKLESFFSQKGPISAMALDRGGSRLVLGTPQALLVLASDSGNVLLTLPVTSPIQVVAVSAEAGYMASGDSEGSVSVWDFETGKLLHQLPHAEPVEALGFSPDGRWLAVGNGPRDVPGTISLYALD